MNPTMAFVLGALSGIVGCAVIGIVIAHWIWSTGEPDQESRGV